MKVTAGAMLHSYSMLPALLVTLLLSPLQGNEMAPNYSWLYPDAFFGASTENDGMVNDDKPTIVKTLAQPVIQVLSNGPVCPDEQLLLNARVTNIEFGVTYIYSWTGPNTFVSNEANPSITGYTDGTHNGTYNVTVTNTSDATLTIGSVTVATDNISCVGQDCVSSEFLYLNDDIADIVHKFQVMPNGDLIEVGSPWFNDGAVLSSPHGVTMDPNGFLYINSLLSNTTVKFDCDGNVLENPTATVSSLGHVIVGNYLFATTQAVPEHIQVFSLCDGNLDEVGYVDLGDRDDANFSDFPWGIVYNTLDGMIYVTEGEGGADGNGAVYMIDPSNPEDVGSVWQTNATIPPILSGLNSIAGIAFDSNNFMYLAGDEDTPNQTFVRKYEFITGTWTQVGEITDATFDNVGFGGGRGLTYSTSTDLIYLGSFEDCVAIIDPDPFAYVRPGIGVVPGSSAKATGIVTEGCYRGANPIDVTVCTDADPIVLRDLIGCNVCGGDWTRTDGNAGGTYDACNRTFDPTGNTAGASFTFAGNNDLCGAFNIVVNITYATTTATASTTQATCNGNTASNDAELILTAASNATHYNFVAGSDYEADGGNTDIINATAFDPATDLPLTLANTLPNPSGSQDYTIRVFNNLSSCFEDVTVTLDEMSCVVTNCSLTIDDVTINCTNNTNFTVDATLSWDFADLPTTNELIDVTFDGATMTIDPASMATGTGMVSFTSMQPDYALPITANFASTTTCSASTLIDLIACTPDCVNGPGTLGGNVFNDFNNDGADAGPGEVGQANVLVEVYDCDGVLVCSTWTNADGNWTCPDLNDMEEYRVEFSAPLQPYLQPSFAGDDNGTNTQFVTAPNCEVDYGVVDATDYCQENPDLAIPCYVTGPADGNDPGLIGFDYEMGGFSTLASTAEVGTSWGLAHQRMGNTIYTSAYLKRYAGLSQGLGHIFMTNPVAGFVGSFDLNGVNGIDVGTVDRTSGPDFVLNADGFSRDLDAFAKIGEVGYGDMDIYEDEQLFVVNLNTQTIITIDVSDPSTLPTDGSMINTALVTEHTLALPSCSGGVMRPFALKIHEGRGYIGVVCDASISESTRDLRAYVFSFDPANPSGLLTEEISFALDYTREPAGVFTGAPDFPSTWLPWVNTWDDLEKVQYDNGNGNRWYINHHAPYVADIEFADDGGMIIGLGDRAGDQFGFNNLVPLPASQPINPGLATVFNGGDLLKACYIDGGYTLEGGSADCAVSDLNPNNVLTLNTDGPSGVGEFFYADVFGTTQGHAEISLGAVAFLSGNNEVVAAIYDPEDFNSQGVARYSTVDGSRTDFLTIVTGAAQTFGKANGLGDLELVCDLLPIQIGNFVWIDTDMDGVQDACEEPVSNLPVSLYNKATMMFVGVDTTDANGNYYFSDVDPDTEYAIIFGYDANDMNSPWDATTMELTLDGNTYGLTTAGSGEGDNDDFNDSDATIMDMAGLTGYPIISYTTADTTDHTLDVGLIPAAGLTLGSTVFLDNNNDGMQNGADTGIANVEVQLFDVATGLQVLTDANGVRVADVADAATVVTDSDGNYIFSDLPAGDYYVVISSAPATAPISSNDSSSGFMETDPDDNADNDDDGLQTGGSGTIVSSDTITLSSGDEPLNQADGGTESAQGNMQDDADDANGNMTLDFGFFAPVSVGDTAFVDLDNDGLQTMGEPGVENVTVTIFDNATGMPVDFDAEGNAYTSSTMTDPNGRYIFENLPPGEYYVIFDISTVTDADFYTFTTNDVDGDMSDADDSDADPANGQTPATDLLASGEDDLSLDVGIACNVMVTVAEPTSICSTQPIDLTQGASITPASLAGTWSSSGNGTFDGGTDFATATTYTPGSDDIAVGTVTLTLTTADPAGPCDPIADTVVFTILKVDCGSFFWPGSND